ncbi:hypothetical protein KFL_007390050 [Klebsormidium nitens]|uniref:Transmembrane protein n=1 Tax=Klebsormidium nitens TaxID=105231 RepID=A0A1Y1IPP0_KLENI|nr:hypothetical protein KFL_007390050 [Klebsormidium nitens]|eukprot:TRINITY_DN18456_c0_g1_i1.p1 TRINITY_DN18456_c0_g1~~TRINITY_DN18456_c0_g1_i1.p1  ORF type:complete len:145 (-),score=1.16 TRINITY_DN18456_c0_g1_i1:360-794(-)
MAPGQARQVLTSLTLEILFYFGKLYDYFYWILTLLIFIYKGSKLPYPKHVFGLELAFLFMFLIVEPTRIFLGSKGNKTEQAGPLGWSLALAAPILSMHFYFILGQTYVLRIEQFLNGVGVGFAGLQVLMGLLTTAAFMNASQRL